jgi:hypothetical protein
MESPVPLTTTDLTPAPNGAPRTRRRTGPRHPLLGVGPRALEVYRLWVAYLLAHQRPPSYREVVAALGMRSPHGVAQHLAALVREGLLERVPGAVKTGTHPCPHRLAGVTLRLEYAEGPAGERARLALEGGASCPPT